jgi:hypothetical protein
MFTVLLQVLVQPFLLILSVTVNDPDAPAVTLIDAPLVAPTMVPLPLIDQLCVTVPLTGNTVDVYVLPVEVPQTGSGPAIVQLGIGFTVTVLLQVLVQPFLLILSVTV